MRDKIGRVSGGLAGLVGGLLAVIFVGAQVGLFVGGISYRKDCANSEGTMTKDWTFTWFAPIPYLFRPDESGCVVHTGTRVALNAVGIAKFSETTTTKIAEESLSRDAAPDAETEYWVKTRSALVDYIERNRSRKTLPDAIRSIDTLLAQLSRVEAPGRYAGPHQDLVSALTTMKRHGNDLMVAARSGDNAAYGRAQQQIEPATRAVQKAIQRLNMAHAAGDG